MLHPGLFVILLIAVCGYAILCGRSDERWAGWTCLGATAATRFAISPAVERYSSVETGVLLVDGVTFLIFTAIALRSDRFWPLWVSGLQLTTSVAHFLKAVESDLLPAAYGAAGRFWSYPILLIIVIGTWRSHRHRLQSLKSRRRLAA